MGNPGLGRAIPAPAERSRRPNRGRVVTPGRVVAPSRSMAGCARMPGTNLTREEAAARAALLDVTSYAIDLDLTTGDKTFASTTTSASPAASPVPTRSPTSSARSIHEITLNGAQPRPGRGVRRQPDRADRPPGRQRAGRPCADCTYSHSGEGLHRFVDPVDDRVYLYTQFEVPDARRVFTTFEQPDLKSCLHLDRRRAGGLEGRLQRRRRRSPRSSATAGPAGASRRPSGCRPTSRR